MFDSADFNSRLFFARPDTTRCPPRSRDVMVPVSGATLHVRLHAFDAAHVTVVLFHGNGEVVADYDELSGKFGQVQRSRSPIVAATAPARVRRRCVRRCRIRCRCSRQCVRSPPARWW